MAIDEFGEIRVPVLRTRYNYDMNAASRKSALFCPEPTRAQQNFKEECDINTIVERFGLTGELPTGVTMPFQGDFEHSMDYQDSLDKLRQAQAAFMQFPADVRGRFQNDAGQFVAFVSDEANKDEVKKWGLLRAERPLPAPIEVRVIPDPTPTPKTAPEASAVSK